MTKHEEHFPVKTPTVVWLDPINAYAESYEKPAPIDTEDTKWR
jgi:hypothetical protein